MATMMAPSQSPAYEIPGVPSPATEIKSASKIRAELSPSLIPMLAFVVAAFLIVTYFRLISRYCISPLVSFFQKWVRRRRRARTVSVAGSDIESPQFFDEAVHFLSPYGLDDSVIKSIPLSVYCNGKIITNGDTHDCAVCLVEFEENDLVRTLPVCFHTFHVDCIDVWLRSHANCPLCRSGIMPSASPFVPMMASRVRPSLDEGILASILLDPPSEINNLTSSHSVEESEVNEDGVNHNVREFHLKRSYSFGFERNLATERLVLEAMTASPWRYRRGGFWSKRPSPFCSSKPRGFSSRYYRAMKSPFFRRRGYFSMSESGIRFPGSSRRTKSLNSPIFFRSSAFSSNLEALLSPERLGSRR